MLSGNSNENLVGWKIPGTQVNEKAEHPPLPVKKNPWNSDDVAVWWSRTYGKQEVVVS
jgi:hypothetical protein